MNLNRLFGKPTNTVSVTLTANYIAKAKAKVMNVVATVANAFNAPAFAPALV
jgi:hypothetical protein